MKTGSLLRKALVSGLGLAFAMLPVRADDYAGYEWSIAIWRGPSPLALAPPSDGPTPTLTARDVTDRTATFVADPFIVNDNGTWTMFFEVYDHGQGDIAVATSPDASHWTYRQIVIDEPFHLSFPYVFQSQGTWYMIPESHAARNVRLYRATAFPTQWTFVQTLLDNVDFVDPMIVNRNNTWFLFAAPPTNDSLRLFTSASLTGPYTEHPLSPIVSGNGHVSRGAGRLLEYNGQLYRYAQDDAPTYGIRTQAFQITDLTTTTYAEVPVVQNPIAQPGKTGWNAQGMHTVNPVQFDASTWIAAVDGQGDSSMMSKANWAITYVDSQETTATNGAAANLLDGSPSTTWQTQFQAASPPPPHEVQIDLGASADVFGFRYLPRQDGGSRGNVGGFEFYVSADGVNWGQPVTYGSFANDGTRKEIRFDTASGRYARFRETSSAAGDPYATVAEFDLLGATVYGNHPPTQAIQSPGADTTIYMGDALTFAGLGSDVDGDFPLSYLWRFDDGSGVPNSTLQNPGPVVFRNPGIYNVTFRATDARGRAATAPDMRTITVLSKIIPQANWRVAYYDSQETVGEYAPASNAIDGNKATFWHTQWKGAQPPPPHEIQVDLGVYYDVEGFRYLPRQDGGVNGRFGQYEFYVSADGVTWGAPLATGTFANDATEKEVKFSPTTARYVRLREISAANGDLFASMAELNVLGLASVSGSNAGGRPQLGLLPNLANDSGPALGLGAGSSGTTTTGSGALGGNRPR